jgi:hypothetical protein
MDASQKWGLPPDFAPVRYAIPDHAKIAVRALLGADEPVIVSLSNEEELVSIVATPERIITVRAQELGVGAGTSQVKSFPWPSVFDLTLRPQLHTATLVIEYRTSDGGKTVEIGRRALLAKPKSDTFLGFQKAAGEDAFRALLQVWNWKKQTQTGG